MWKKVSVVKPDGFDDRTLVVNCNPSSRFVVATIESEIKSIRVNYTLQLLSGCCNINLQLIIHIYIQSRVERQRGWRVASIEDNLIHKPTCINFMYIISSVG